MASLLNSKKDISFTNTGADTSFTGQWEDIKDYTSAIITLQSPMDGSATLQWAHTSGRRFPEENDIIATESFKYTSVGHDMTATDLENGLGPQEKTHKDSEAVTKQFDHRARWFRIKYENNESVGTQFDDMSFNLQTLYKKAATELKIVDDCANIVSVNVGDDNKNSLYTMLTDASGAALRTTNDAVNTGEALYTHLADSSGHSLATTETNAGSNGESLFVALRDGSNNAFSSTGANVTHNALYIRPGDVCGNAQASTYDVSGASTSGVALYAALADSCGNKISTTNQIGGDTNVKANALYVHLATKDGKSVTENNPLPVVNTQESTGALAFDISYGVKETFVSPHSDLKDTSGEDLKINVYNLFVYNDSPVTVWLKIYDVCTGMLRSAQHDLIDNFPESEEELSASLNQVTNAGQEFDTSANLKYNLTVPGGRSRDLTLPGGTTFNHGMYVRATTQYKADSIQGPGDNAVFFNGSYTKPSA